jgi:enoyl-[acyl-carrier protein] reductase I
MSLLSGKTALIFGIANDHSIAWGIAQAFHQHGAQLGFSYAGESLERRVQTLADSIGVSFVEPCDVTRDGDIKAVMAKAKETFGQIDILVHAIAFANREDLMGRFHNTSREGFQLAMDISVYSFIALAGAAAPLMKDSGSMLTLTFYGGQKVFPNYNLMGVAKAALEASTRYLAADLGQQQIRVNAISAGPIRTLSASGVSGFKNMHRQYASLTPLQRNITLEDIGGAAVWLASDLAKSVTGEVLFVDSGYNILGLTVPQQEPG